MNRVVSGLEFVTVYIDDILVASSSQKQHTRHLQQLFQRLREYGLKIHPQICIFGVEALDFLGHQVSPQGITPLPQKVLAIRVFPQPQTARKLREFLGITNYYHRFVPHAAETLAPLNDLLKGLKKNSRKILTWTDDAQQAFTTIKHKLADLTLLAHPAPNAPTSLTTDALATAIGAVLQQEINGTL